MQVTEKIALLHLLDLNGLKLENVFCFANVKDNENHRSLGITTVIIPRAVKKN